jgi:putative DNA modification/repair radical SAM protein
VDTLTKLGILAEAAKYDAACTSSGVERGPVSGKLGIASDAGCCHAFTADGRCITLLKVLMSNACAYDCAYCVNRRSNSCRRATFSPRELAELTVDFYKRNYIEGLFLSSGIIGDADATTERMICCLRILRGELRFNGYVHAKAIPGTSPELVDELGRLADRLSVNIELPSAASLEALCPDKTSASVMRPMSQIASTISDERHLLGEGRKRRLGEGGRGDLDVRASGLSSAARERRPRRAGGTRRFAPAGQSTQMIIGASPEDDNHILTLSQALYQRFGLKRIFFSAYVPVVGDPLLPEAGTPVPLRREHRLYQADWLMRFYSFTPDELVTPDEPWLDLDIDPKLAWALRHPERFPIEVNEATRSDLLRVPGIGVTGADRIVHARRRARLGFDDLRRLHITLKRARYFITCAGEPNPAAALDADEVRREVIADARGSRYNQARRQAEGQATLF